MSTHTYKRGTSQAAGPLRDLLGPAGRAGFTARGVIYLLVGFLAARIAFGDGDRAADRQGALRQIGQQPFGTFLLWLLAVGLAGMALWRGAQAAAGGEGAGKRAAGAARAVFYAVVCWGTATYAAGVGGGSGSDQQSKDWTATVLKLPAGRWLAGAAGVGLCAAGLAVAVRAVRRTFLKKLETARMGRRTRMAVTVAGACGGAARGAVYAGAGVFVVVAAVRFDPHRAKGMDDTLRAFAHTPAGPWLLVAVAAGLALFGVFSFASARWRRL
ncbi:DUF1206 domain-containing protein [Actinacidiphila yeochonensis]|uniref:DUF1206 domain-containing protein n=1 Tax=Actinacidiphila yeochonensis TaxID=89050 RepID=UPI000560998B|nr:DUF1206 domain-containing protein [Actinacidiphila yeochonensis]